MFDKVSVQSVRPVCRTECTQNYITFRGWSSMLLRGMRSALDLSSSRSRSKEGDITPITRELSKS
jgi:hypothetical protein